MSTLTATAERTIAVPAEDLFCYVADFREHHPHFLPPAFQNFTVEAGGVGLGTVTSSSFSMGGRTQFLRTRVTRVEDARIIAQQQRLNPDSWTDLKKALPQLAKPEVAAVAKKGFARGGQAVIFVENIRAFYDILKQFELPHPPPVLAEQRG